jgi:fatty acyl-CoA reductase
VKVALFDFDGTILRDNSFHLLIRHQLGTGIEAWFRLAPMLAARVVRLGTSRRLKNQVLRSYSGWSRTRLESLGCDLYQSRLRGNLYPQAIAELERLKSLDYRVCVISGAFDFMLAPFCREFGIHTWVGASVAYEGQTCLGRLETGEMRGNDKVLAATAWPWFREVNWAESIAFSDEASDAPMMELCGKRVVVGQGRDRQVVHRIRQAELGSW